MASMEPLSRHYPERANQPAIKQVIQIHVSIFIACEPINLWERWHEGHSGGLEQLR